MPERRCMRPRVPVQSLWVRVGSWSVQCVCDNPLPDAAGITTGMLFAPHGRTS
jgi:hypothetical protein